MQAVKASSTSHAPAIKKHMGRNTADQLSKREYKFFIKQANEVNGVNAARSRTKAAVYLKCMITIMHFR